MKVLLVIFVSVLCMVFASVDYCKIDCQGDHHIGCNNTGAFSSECGDKPELLNLDGELKQAFIDNHNDLRDIIASGTFDWFEPAAQMGAVSWDDELAEVAALHVRWCNMTHDKCRNTKNYEQAGQNLAFATNLRLTPLDAIGISVNGWFDEFYYADMSVIDSYFDNGWINGHFTTVVNERNSKIGCAMIHITASGMPAYFITCNYARNNIGGETVYKSGEPASECKSGIDPVYTSLCSTSEEYDV